MMLVRTSLAVMLLLIVQRAACKPQYFIAGTNGQAPPCLELPNQGFARHAGVTQDKEAVYQLLSNKKPVASVCPGQTYELKVTYPAARAAILVSSVGTFKKSYKLDADCPNRLLLDYHVNSDYKDLIEEYTATLTVPCSSKGELRVSSASAANGLDSYHLSSAAVTINPSCAAATCDSAAPTKSPPAGKVTSPTGSKESADDGKDDDDTKDDTTSSGSVKSSTPTTSGSSGASTTTSNKTETTSGSSTAGNTTIPTGTGGANTTSGQVAGPVPIGSYKIVFLFALGMLCIIL